jgi:hypothetical protein
MNLEELACKVIVAAEEKTGADFMVVGALAGSACGLPLSSCKVKVIVGLHTGDGINGIVRLLDPKVEFDPQIIFDTLTRGRRHVGRTRSDPPLKVELFELFDDPFVQSEFGRRQQVFIPILSRTTWLPTPEDVVVQKLRWGRNTDLDDARDVLAVQDPATLDMAYIEQWCARHGTTQRLHDALAAIPPM